MKLIALRGVAISIMCLACSCGSDTNIVPDQRTAITKYLESQNAAYDNISGTYRYVANAQRDGRDLLPKAANGDVVECYFEAYTFESSPGALYYTNKRLVLPEGMSSPAWSTDPLKLTVGAAGVIGGLANGLPNLAVGDSVQLFITSDLGYGNKLMGVVPENTALLYILNITDVKKQ